MVSANNNQLSSDKSRSVKRHWRHGVGFFAWRKLKTVDPIIAAATLLYVAVFVILSFWKYQHFLYNAFDLAILHQAFFNTLHGDTLFSSIQDANYASEHLTPILFLLIPLYAPFPHPTTLLVLQTIILAACAWPLYLIAKHATNSRGVARAIALAWLLNPFVHSINLFEFHLLSFAPFFVFWACYFFIIKRFKPFVVFLVLSALVREDVSLILIGFSVVAFLEHRDAHWKYLPALLGGVYFVAANSLARALSPLGTFKFTGYYQWLSTVPPVSLPAAAIIHLLQKKTFIFIIVALLPTTFFGLTAAGWLSLSALPLIQLGLTKGGASTTFLLMHYGALVLPGVFIATIYGVKEFLDHPHPLALRVPEYKKITLLVLVGVSAYTALVLGPVGSTVGAAISQPQPTALAQNQKTLINRIPAAAAVASSYQALPALSGRHDVYALQYAVFGQQQFFTRPYALPDQTEFLMVDYRDFLAHELQYASTVDAKTRRENWQAITKDFTPQAGFGPLVLYQKNAPTSPLQLLTPNSNTTTTPLLETGGVTITNIAHAANSNTVTINWRYDIAELPPTFVALTFGTTSFTIPLDYNLPTTPGAYQTNVFVGQTPPKTINLQLIANPVGGSQLSGLRHSVEVIDQANYSEIKTITF